MTRRRAWHPLPPVIAAVSVLMCGAAAYAGLHGIGHTLSPPKPVPERHLALGTRMIGVAGKSAATFHNQTGIQVSLAVSYLSIGTTKLAPTPFGWIERSADGAKPIIDILPGNYSLASIAAGAHDGWLRTFGSEINEPIVVAFAPEANGNWYPWGQQPVQFKAAWHHVWQILHGSDITWMWQMSSSQAKRGSHSHDDITSYWPGSDYVKWIGIDGYFRFPRNTFGKTFNLVLGEARQLPGAVGIPVLLSETAVGPGTHKVVADIRALFAGARAHHLIGVVWFDKTEHEPPLHQNWYLNPGSAAMAAFQHAALSFEKGSA